MATPHSLLPLQPDNHRSTFCPYQSDLLEVLHTSGIIQHLSFCDWITSLSTIVLKVHWCCNVSEFLFLRPKTTPLHVHITLCLPAHLSKDIWAASIFQLLWIMLLWTWSIILCKYIFETLPSTLLGVNPEVELLARMIILLIFSDKKPILFSQRLHHSPIPFTSAQGSNFSTLSNHFWLWLISRCSLCFGVLQFRWWVQLYFPLSPAFPSLSFLNPTCDMFCISNLYLVTLINSGKFSLSLWILPLLHSFVLGLSFIPSPCVSYILRNFFPFIFQFKSSLLTCVSCAV